MPLGPGKYDNELTAALDSARRHGIVEGGILIVIGEPGKHGFACQATTEVLVRLPLMLRYLADQIEADMKGGKL
jgi:hypothetical protein